MKPILYILILSNLLVQIAPLQAAAGSSWFGASKDQPKYPAMPPLRALGAYITDNLDDKMATDVSGTRKIEGFNSWFAQQTENINKLKYADRHRKDTLDAARNKLETSLFIVHSPEYEYEFSVNFPASLKARAPMPAVQDVMTGIYEPLVLHVKRRNKLLNRVIDEYDLSFTRVILLGQPSSYTIYDGAGAYTTADRIYKPD